MKLSDLIAYRELFDHYRITDATMAALRETIDPLHKIVNEHERQFPDLTERLNQLRQSIDNNVRKYDSVLESIRNGLQQDIAGLEHEYLTNSYRLYEEGMVHDTVDLQLTRRFLLPPESHQHILSRIMRHSDWQRPGLIIRPGLEEWIDHLVALDPLYLVDFSQDLIQPALMRFSTVYQRRLRKYLIREENQLAIFENLPVAQFGVCLAYNFFHYRPLEVVRQYLKEVYDLLAPGGQFLLTINDGDRTGGVLNCERNFMCYTPGSMVTGVAESMGYTVNYQYHADAATTWIELLKPGQRTSLRGGQVMAKVIRRDIIDKGYDPAYTTEQREALILEAIELKIDTPIMCRYNYSPRELEKLIKRRKKENARPPT